MTAVSDGRAAKRKLKDRATKAERALMAALDAVGEPYSFQYQIRTAEADAGHYYVDFFLPRRRLLVELDGAAHFTERGKWRDRLRSEAIMRARPDLTVLRFANGDVLRDTDALAQFLRTYP